MIEDGLAVHYSAVTKGTPVYSADEQVVGEIVQVVDNYREHILDGFVIRTPDGEYRWVDGPEVRRTAERGVTITLSAAEAAELGPPPDAAPEFQANPRVGRIGRMLGGGWKRKR